MECLAGDTVVLPNLGKEWRDSPSNYVTEDLGELEEGGGTLMGINVGKISFPRYSLGQARTYLILSLIFP